MKEEKKEKQLFIVGTPIGNLEDITVRALRVLKEADVILAEDTRVTKNLLRSFDIHTPLLSYHTHSGNMKYEKIFSLLNEGKHLALVSDAGMPSIADPGASLISSVREKYGDEILEVIPGPTALTTALARAGVYAHTFTFLGFPPHKKGRKTFFEKIKDIHEVIIFYESPHRAEKALQELSRVLEGEERKVFVCRELTKIFEEVVSGSPQDILSLFLERKDAFRGEWVIIIV
jgi:16S rRNA (cytidine1402-2'-O)-methyltransferase